MKPVFSLALGWGHRYLMCVVGNLPTCIANRYLKKTANRRHTAKP